MGNDGTLPPALKRQRVGGDGRVMEAFPAYEDLFSTLPTQAGVVRKKLMVVTPQTSIESTGPIQFQINVGSNEQIFPSGIRIAMALDIRDSRTKQKFNPHIPGIPAMGDTPAVEEAYHEEALNVFGPEMGHAAFNDLTVFLNDQKIDGGDALYAYKAALQQKLFTTIEQKKGSMRMTGYNHKLVTPFEDLFPDEQDWIKALNASKPVSALKTHIKGAFFKLDENVEKKHYAEEWLRGNTRPLKFFVDQIYTEICQQNKPLPPGAKLNFNFTRSKPEFCLLNRVGNVKAPAAYIHFEYCKLLVPVIEMEDKMAAGIEHMALRGGIPMQFPMRLVRMLAMPKGGGQTDLSMENILAGSGVTPRRIFVTLVKTEAMNGDYTLDPFNFSYFDVDEVSCRLSGQLSSLPCMKIPVQDEFWFPVWCLQSTLNSEGAGSREIGITEHNWKKRNCIFAFDVSGFAGNEFMNCYTREIRQPTGLHIRLKSPLQDKHKANINLTVLVYKEYDAELHIDAYGKVDPLPDA